MSLSQPGQIYRARASISLAIPLSLALFGTSLAQDKLPPQETADWWIERATHFAKRSATTNRTLQGLGRHQDPQSQSERNA